jgi:predicted GNAT family N-acyltransferase
MGTGIRVEAVAGSLTSELRRAVLRPAWAVGAAMPGDDRSDAVHLAALTDNGSVVGACVLFPRACDARPDETAAWQLRGMATAEHLRGRGIGAAVLDEAARQVRDRGGRLLWCEARERAIAFYARHGFVGDGEIYLNRETGIPHQRMWRELFDAPASSTQ